MNTRFCPNGVCHLIKKEDIWNTVNKDKLKNKISKKKTGSNVHFKYKEKCIVST